VNHLGHEILLAFARELIATAERNGMVLTIEQRPLTPLAQGNFETVASVRNVHSKPLLREVAAVAEPVVAVRPSTAVPYRLVVRADGLITGVEPCPAEALSWPEIDATPQPA
jgi:hypothetical protein